MYKYKKIGLGGTFDHFHKGHQAFLLFASELAEHLIIGITTPEMISHKKYFSQIEEYEIRAEAVKNFTKNFFNKVDVIPLTDPYGPTLVGSNVEALAATTATRAGAEAVNAKRAELGLSVLPIHTCELIKDENGDSLASERIREGKVNRFGKVYANIFRSGLTLTEEQKQFFTKPQGAVVQAPTPGNNFYVVGDTCLETFQKNNWPYQIGVVDFLKQRREYQPHLVSTQENELKVANKSGEISKDLVQTFTSALDSPKAHVIIDGEEDLAAVVLVLLAPLGSHIYYGQPTVGMIEMIATESKKEEVYKILTS